MSKSDLTDYEYAQTSWQQSIAVNITAQIIWIIVPIVFISSILLFKTIESDLSKIFSYRIDALSHRVSEVLSNKPDLNKEQKDKAINQIAAELDFKAISVSTSDYQLTTTIDTSALTSITQTVPLASDQSGNFEITSYYVPLSQIIDKKRKDILAIVLLCLVAFSLFLVFSIRQWLFKPLRTLVDATEAVSVGSDEVNLDTDRRDEFGHLSKFFEQMIRSLNEQRNKLNEAVKVSSEANAAKSNFLSNMTHELRTPLNAIIGYTEMILDEAVDSDDKTYVSDLNKILSAARHLLHLINEVLDLSKIEAGKMERHITPVDVDKLIRDVSTTIKPLVKQNNNKLKVEYDSKITGFRSDVAKIQQVLFNLLGNASKFTNDGVITLSIKQINIGDNNNVELTVSDTGIGMMKNKLELLFNPFVQEDDSTTRLYGGTGLGLSISKRICNLLGGDISVCSTKGEGSIFTVTLPVDVEAKTGSGSIEIKPKVDLSYSI